MSKHSPGPWEWKYGHRHVWSSAGHPVIGATDDRDGYSSRCRIVCPNPADAALIASAPAIAAHLDEAVGLLRRIGATVTGGKHKGECASCGLFVDRCDAMPDHSDEYPDDFCGGRLARRFLAAIDAEKAREGT